MTSRRAPGDRGGTPPPADPLVEEGLRRFNQGQPAAAIPFFTTAIRKSSKNANTYFFRSFAHKALGDKKRAMADIARAIRLDPRTLGLRLQSTQMLMELGEGRETLKQCEAAIRIAPRSSLAHEVKAGVELALGLKGQAWRSLRRAITIDPRSTSLRMKAANFLKSFGKEEQALKQLKEGIRLAPKPSAAYEAKSDIESSWGMPQRAWESLHKAIDLEPGAPTLRRKAVAMLKGMGEFPEALRQCEAWVRLAPDAEPWLATADIETYLGLWDRAGASIRTAATLGARDADVLIQAAALSRQMLAFDRAFQLLRRAVRCDPQSVNAVAALAGLHLWRGEFRQAAQHAANAIALNPGHPAARRIRGAAAAMQGRPALALAALDAAIQLDPRDAEAFVWRAEVRRRLGRLQDALEDLTRSLALVPAQLGAFINSALVKLALGEPVPTELGDYIRSRVPREIADLKKEFSPYSLERTLEHMKGNRSVMTTFARGRGRRLRLVQHLHYFPRDILVELQSTIRFGDADRVLGQFDRLVRRTPGEAYLYSHRAEVYLWVGRYGDAARDFRRARKLNPGLLWPKVGLTGVHLMRGEFARARDRIEAIAKFGGSDSILGVWRGEIYRRLGDPERALAELGKVKEVLPFRPALWINLALTKGDLGDRDGQRELFLRLERHLGGFISDAVREAGLKASDRRRPDAAIRRALEKALEMMRGNRSRWMYTYFTRAGELRHIRIRSVPANAVPPGLVGYSWMLHRED